MPYIAELEKKGIPTVLIDLTDQHEMVKQEALVNGVPNVRFLPASRTLPGPEDVQNWIKPMLEELTRPLTAKEKESGLYSPPQPRVLFEGTLDDAVEFYNQARHVPDPLDAPIQVYTDGLPIVIPTEERVAAMCKATSHRPDEVITYQSDRGQRMFEDVKKGDVVRFQPMKLAATVEQVAVNAVMAGCKPEYFPIILAIAESGVPTGTTVYNNQWCVVSGPIAKEIGMNAGLGMLGPGNRPNSTIGRAYQLMAINLGGAVPGINRMSSLGSPMNRGGMCFAEDADSLPPGWLGLNEEHGFKKSDNVVMVMGTEGGLDAAQFSPGGYRAFQKSGHGGIARRLGVKGKPGPHNFLDFVLPGIWAGGREGARTFIMVHEMAQHLYEMGYKSKAEVYEYIWKKGLEPLSEYRKRSWVDLTTNGWMGVDRQSGKPWKELPEDHLISVAGDHPGDNCIIVCGSDEEVCMEITGGPRAMFGFSPFYSIDAWR